MTYKHWRKEEKLRQREEGKIYQLNAEFQRIAMRDKKALFSYQSKEIEESNKMGKTKDLLRKLEIPRGYFMQRWAQ